MQKACGKIVTKSFRGTRASAIADCHAFVHELERWSDALSTRKEHHLLSIAAREYQFSMLALTHGLYRQAFKGLRLVLEVSLQSVHLSAHQVELCEWLESRADTRWSAIIDEQNGVFSSRFARAFFPDLEVHVSHYGSLAKKLYRECSECVHGGVQNYVALPDSLEFSDESFLLWCENSRNIAMVIVFAMSLRYLRELDSSTVNHLEHDVLDRVGHVAPIRVLLGGPRGG